MKTKTYTAASSSCRQLRCRGAWRRTSLSLLLLMLTTMTAWAGDVNLKEDEDIAVGTAGHYYVNMPVTGTSTLTLTDASVTTFKVYDDGGKDGKYSDNCNATLVLTAPTGYILQLSGIISTQGNKTDMLTVYDNSEASGTKLLDAVTGDNIFGNPVNIDPVASTSQSMTLYFVSDNSMSKLCDGFDLTVTLLSANTEYNVNVDNPATGGSIAATPTSATANDKVTLTATSDNGYLLSGINVKGADNNPVAVTWDGPFSNTATFNMPASAVTVTPTFSDNLTADGGLYINMPATDSKTLTIPSGVESFKVYDDGGKDGKYSDNCNATLVLTAPTGYILQLSGIISTQGNNTDMLTVYDNSEASGTKLLDAVTGDNIFGNPVNIDPVASTSQSMTLKFVSDNTMSMLCDGFDLTVTLVPSVGGDEIPEAPKCATPTISLVNGEIIFGCETEGAEFVSEVTVSDAKAYYDNKVSAPKKFKVKVHATKSGYNDSDEVTEEFDFSGDTSRSGDVDGNGLVNVADHVELSKIILNQQGSE